MEREVRYCTTEDGVRIAYCVEGEGAPLVVCPAFIESLAMDELFPEVRSFYARLAGNHAVIRYDARGTGLSQRQADDMSVDGHVLDVVAVTEAAGVGRFAIFGSASAGPMAIQFVATHPNLVTQLILHGTFARVDDWTTREQRLAYANLARVTPAAAAQVGVDPSMRDQLMPVAVAWAKLLVESRSGEMMAEYFDQNIDLDVTPHLTNIQAPTLVLHRASEERVRFELGQRLAESIPGARLVALSGSVSHYAFGDPEAVLRAIEQFLGDKPSSAASLDASVVRTVLFTEVVRTQ